jgi:hypothetical protein
MTRSTPSSAAHHREWLGLVTTTGPFLSLPVLRRVWPTLDGIDKDTVQRLRAAHTAWLDDQATGQGAWIDHVLRELLGWGDDIHNGPFDHLAVTVPEHDAVITPTFALVEPGSVAAGEPPAPQAVRLLGLVIPFGQAPTARVPDDAWAATPVDRLAQVCRARGVPLGLVTDGRWWTLIYAPKQGATATVTFDAIAWPETAERVVLRAFVSLLSRRRFFGVPENERLVALFQESKDAPEDITEALGVQVRRAVELLVGAIGRSDELDRRQGGRGLLDVPAHEIYRGAVTVMMRVVFLLFAEERNLLPADNDIYINAYSVGRLCADLEEQAALGSEEELEHSFAAWHRLLALFDAVHGGVNYDPHLRIHAHGGALFDPAAFPWLPMNIDDRTVLHMLRSVQYVQVGTGTSRERRRLSFRTLDVEQIGYVYEGLLSFDGLRASDVTVGLIGKAGEEEEVLLTELEAIAPTTSTVDERAAALAEKYKDSKIGTAAKLAKLLAPLSGVELEETRKRLLAVTGGDYALAERLLPFAGIIRDDLRGLPMVILPGGLYVTESRLRRTTGTHYTPRKLADEVVEGALEPLVYRVGPLQTADREQWVPKSSEEILALRVADIAVGSAAFLVAAARYLADHLIAAWAREGDPAAQAYTRRTDDQVDPDFDPVVIRARRQVIEHCLYGVDINPMAVDMAKLSLWLVTMSEELPFTFLDDRIVVGDSLLGITSMEQLEWMHLDPAKGRKIHEGSLLDSGELRSLVASVADTRRRIADLPDDTVDAHDEKRRLLAEAEQQTEQARLLADLVVGAALAHAKRGEAGLQAGSVAANTQIEKYLKGGEAEREDVRAMRDRWLATDNPDTGTPRQPLHWPLVFPEVFERGGFDAIIGNPPFLHGTKVTASMGTSYRELLVIATANGRRGNADLVAYFALRAHELIGPGAAQVGLIATNSLAAGDSREVGLDQITAQGISIIRAVKSRPWPSRSATVEYCAVWTARESEAASAARVLDGRIVSGITSTLDAVGRATGKPHRLWANKGLVYNGSKIDGVGFTMDGARARELIEADGRNAEVLSPFLNGQDVNSSPEHRASRWVVNFRDWSMARAASYPACFDHVVRFVKPERELNNDRIRRERWWCFGRPTVELYNAISGQDRTIVITAVSKTVMPAMVSAKQTFSHALNVFASADMALFALLSSGPHYWWVASWASAMRTDIRYAPSDVFETFALPEMTEEMRRLGDRLDTYRRDLMLARQAGLTATYNLVNDPTCRDADIEELRNIHRQIDEAVCRAYGWDDLLAQGLDHDFYDLGREVRYTIGPSVRQEILDRLLELNHERYAAEVAAGLHDKKTGAGAKKTGTRGKKKTNAAQPALALDGDPDDAEESA